MKRLLLFASILSLAITGKAQYSMDFGLSLGGANYIGEIGYAEESGLLDVNLSQSNLSIGGFFRYSFTPQISAKLQVNYLRIQGADSLTQNPVRIARNLSFRTDIVEAMLTGEFNFISIKDMNRRSRSRVDFDAYGFAGIGVLFYYPYAQYNNEWYYLRPLQTEGTENAYNEMTIGIPFGIGANFSFNKKIKIGAEVGYRMTFTDYLDDISTDYAAATELPFQESFFFASRAEEVYRRGNTSDLPPQQFFEYNEEEQKGAIRGNPQTNDGYLLMQVNVSYMIGGGNNFYKSRYGNIVNRKRKRRKF